MKRRQQEAPEYTTDADGQQLVRIALATTDQRATLYAEDFQRLTAAGFSSCWSLADVGYGVRYVLVCVRTLTPGRKGRRSLTVARLVAEAGKGQRVRYADGDRLNLRRENLVLEQGRAGAEAAAIPPNLAAALKAGEAPGAQHPAAVQATGTPAQSKPRWRPVRPTESAGNPRAPSEPAAAYTAHVIDRAALSARVREQMARRVEQVTGQV